MIFPTSRMAGVATALVLSIVAIPCLMIRPVHAEDGSALTRSAEQRRDRIRRCLAIYFRAPIPTSHHTPWEVLHSVLPFGIDSELIGDDRRVNGVGWLCFNGPCSGYSILTVSGRGLVALRGPTTQGHEGQLLAILAQSRVKPDYPIRIVDREFTVADLATFEARTCRSEAELTFKLIGLSHYLRSDQVWRSDSGESWTVDRLIQLELKKKIVGATCGGTHRLMGLSTAVQTRQDRREPLDGHWQRADRFVRDHQERALKLQNPDGSFSTNWFASRGVLGGDERNLETTGHILEWLVYSLPADRLDDERIVRAVDLLTTWLSERQRWALGPRGHAVHALALYDERMFGGQPGRRAEQLGAGRLTSDK